MSTFDPVALECLAAIVEEGGFDRAAQRLNVTQSAVSQRLRTLEAQAGTVLIVRSRPLRPTPAGHLQLKHTKQLRLLRADLERDLRELAPSSTGRAREEERISIAVNADSIATWALPAMNALARQGLPLEIIADDQDFTDEWLREGQVLGCITTLIPQPASTARTCPSELGTKTWFTAARRRPKALLTNSDCMSSLRLKAMKGTSRKLCGVRPCGRCAAAYAHCATAT